MANGKKTSKTVIRSIAEFEQQYLPDDLSDERESNGSGDPMELGKKLADQTLAAIRKALSEPSAVVG